MKIISSTMATHLAQEVTTLCTCWKIVRQDGTVFGFTDHDRDLTVDGQLYECETGYNRTAMTSDSTMGVPNMDVTGVLTSDRITDEELRNGLFDFAHVYVFIVNWANPVAADIVKMRRGWFGEVTQSQNGTFSVELRGLSQALAHSFVESFTPECRADFCDLRCGLLLSTFQQTGTVTAAASRSQFTGSGITAPLQGFVGGTIQWLTGANAGRTIEIIGYSAGTISMFDACFYPIEVGDTFKIAPGCNKTRDACKSYFNIKNYRGEPDVPGQDEYLKYPDAK